MVGHIGPEAFVGGAIALVRDGDMISIDAEKGTIQVELSDEELAKRRGEWKAPAPHYPHGALAKYAALVGPACYGAVTH
jgi:dihydroxy-acid dehydratase